MRRRDIQLRAAARQGDGAARMELARLYLVGGAGFPRHLETGLSHLAAVASDDPLGAARLISESLRLEELLHYQQLDMLRIASSHSFIALVKLSAWTLAIGELASTVTALRHAANGLHRDWDDLVGQCALASDSAGLLQALEAFCRIHPMDVGAVAMAASRHAYAEGNLPAMERALGACLALHRGPDECISLLTLHAIQLAESTGQALGSLSPDHVQASLEYLCGRADKEAWLIMGRALCGISSSASVPHHQLVRGTNLRKGTALLVRAADAGDRSAWLHLYRLNADSRCSVANPQMARFYLEKAALAGDVEAQRLLGALTLREAGTLHESEVAIGWLYRAHAQGDEHAQILLSSLVLPVEGGDDQAAAIVEDVKKEDPWLAARLSVARHFGLTKLEALSVDLVDAGREWGLVVGRNPYIAQVRLSAPRAVPAVRPAASASLRAASALYRGFGGSRSVAEGDLRLRSAAQRRIFAKLGLSEAMFFSRASSSALDCLRIGTKWAHQLRAPLQLALSS